MVPYLMSVSTYHRQILQNNSHKANNNFMTFLAINSALVKTKRTFAVEIRHRSLYFIANVGYWLLTSNTIAASIYNTAIIPQSLQEDCHMLSSVLPATHTLLGW